MDLWVFRANIHQNTCWRVIPSRTVCNSWQFFFTYRSFSSRLAVLCQNACPHCRPSKRLKFSSLVLKKCKHSVLLFDQRRAFSCSPWPKGKYIVDKKISAKEGARTSTKMIIADIVRVTAKETQTITSRRLGRGHEDEVAAAGFTIGLGLQFVMLTFLAIIFLDSTVLCSSQTSFGCLRQCAVFCAEKTDSGL